MVILITCLGQFTPSGGTRAQIIELKFDTKHTTMHEWWLLVRLLPLPVTLHFLVACSIGLTAHLCCSEEQRNPPGHSEEPPHAPLSLLTHELTSSTVTSQQPAALPAQTNHGSAAKTLNLLGRRGFTYKVPLRD